MALEIEKKYLLRSCELVKLLQDEGLELKQSKIKQVYTKISKGTETRLRQEDENFVITTKTGDGLSREEKEEPISRELFELSAKSIIGDVINKTRYSFKLQNLPTCIDVYHEELEGLCILEVEFPSEQTAEDFALLEPFSKEVVKDVTLDKSYKNSSLALYGNPAFKKGWCIKKLQQNIKNNPFGFYFLPLLPPSCNAYESLRVVFYAIFERIKYHQDAYLQSQKNEDLHQLRVNIRKTRSLLQSLDGIFEEGIRQRFVDEFKLVANSTNQKRDMDVFKDYLGELDEIEAEDIFDILNQEKSDSDAICELIRSQNYQNLLHEWEVVLQDEDGFFKGQNADEPFKKIGALCIHKKLKKLKKKLKMLDEATSLEDFHKLRIEFKKFRYLSEVFKCTFENTSLTKTISSSKKMQNLFGLLQDRDVGLGILKSLESSEFAGDVNLMRSREIVEEILIDEVYALKSQILIGKSSLFKVLEHCMKDLKIYIGS